MNEIKIDCRSIETSIVSLQAEKERLKLRGEKVLAIPEINQMNPIVYFDRASYKGWGNSWTVTFQFDKCYARIFDSCRILFVHYEDYDLGGRQEDFVPYHSDEELVEEFKKHVEFLK